MDNDLISREAAICSQIKMIAQGLDWVPVYHLEQLPSAERRGRWIDHSDEWDGGYYECSVCGEAFTFIEGTPKENLYNYCPNCGARMKERSRGCCNCRHNIRTGDPAHIENHCDIDGHYIGYVEYFEGWCRRWAKEKKWEAIKCNRFD